MAARERARGAVRGGVVLGLAVVTVVAGCSSGGPEATPPSSTPSRVLTRFPLTGEVATSGVPNRPVLVVKVDNTASAEPQVGLRKADLVVEELVEGGSTRLAVMLQSRLPDTIGPVRSMRTSDIGVVAPTAGVLVASGAAGVVKRAVAEAGVSTAVEGAPGFVRDSARRAPYNLLAHPSEVIKGLPGSLGPPHQPYLPWASATGAPRGRAVSGATVGFSPGHTTRWHRAAGSGWTRENGLAAGGDGFTADSVLVLHVTTRDAGYKDPAGNPVPETVLEGGGKALLLLGGRAVDARWEKRSAGQPFRFTTPAGRTVRIPPGHVWIELLPERGTVTTTR